MARAAEGDRNAWRALYVAYRDFVFRVALRYLGDEAAAADVAQDVFVTLFRNAAQYRPSAQFTTYLYRIVANRCLNLRARAGARLHDAGASSPEALAALTDPDSPGPEQALAVRERREAVRRAILALPERQRLAIILNRYEGLSYEEIATALSSSVGTVESLLFRARRKLVDVLES